LLAKIYQEAREPKSPLEMVDDLLLFIAQQSPRYLAPVRIQWSDWAKFRQPDREGLSSLLRMVKDMGFVELPSGGPSDFYPHLTTSGWQRVQELLTRRGEGRDVFVAMSFEPILSSAYDDGILPSLETDCGFHAIRVDRENYNDKIDDHIVSQIRRARFVVADVTMHRQGVYFEAGFGFGLGLDVIYTCRNDDIANAHFDTRQYNHVVWETPADLRRKLTDRVRATIIGATPAQPDA